MEILLAYDNLDDVLKLVEEYTNMLLEHGDEVKECLKSQNLTAQPCSPSYATEWEAQQEAESPESWPQIHLQNT